MIKISNRSMCCGCTACKSICPHNAITMHPDKMGFLYPIIDMSACVDCGLCERVCAFNKNYDKSLNLPLPEVFAVRHKDLNEVSSSRSGAAFIALSDWVIEQGGIVYGAGYTDHFRVVHKRADSKEGRNEFKGSKYVQSDLNNTFEEIKRELVNGKIVTTEAKAKEIRKVAEGLIAMAIKEKDDVVFIDTAGRLQNKSGLMDELKKIIRVIKKVIPDAPHSTLLTIDATTGQNAVSQVKEFNLIVPLNGLIVTKLDGSAKGGILASIAQDFTIPVYFIGVGEKIDDLDVFKADEYAKSLLGI